MSIVDEQILGGALDFGKAGTAEDPTTAQLQRDPFGKIATQDTIANLHFKGFNYAPSQAAAAIFGLVTEYVGPNTNSEKNLWNKGTTTYGTPEQFTRLSNDVSTVLTQMGGFVQNGDGVEGVWTNEAMKRDFSQGSGTKSQTNRGDYDLDNGWKVPTNGFNQGHKYEVANVNVDFVSADGGGEEETPELTPALKLAAEAAARQAKVTGGPGDLDGED